MNNITILALLSILILLPITGCGNKSEPEIISEPPPVPRQDIKPTPSKVVIDFLKAIKSENYSKAFKYINAPYTDKEGYINQMKNTVADNDVSILNYRLLATQIYDRTATVIVELDTKLKSLKTGTVVNLTQKSQYSLGLFDNKWLITAGYCIEGCIEKEPVIEVIE